MDDKDVRSENGSINSSNPPSTNKRVNLKLFKRQMDFSLRQLLVFALIFAAIGGYFLWRAFAATTLIKVWDTNTDWNTGVKSSVVVSNGSVSLSPVTAVTSNNLALNKPVTASSVQSNSYLASYAADGSTTTRWSSAFSDPQWLRVDLGANYSISRVVLKWETAYGKAYQIQTSNDGVNWTTIYSTTSGTGGTNDLTGLSGSGRYVRMYGTVRGTGWGYSLWEMEVYGGNLAFNKPATASSIEKSNYPASSAFDGSLSTRWSSAFSDPQWLKVDLGATYNINEVKLYWETAYGKAYQIQVSNDGSTWTTIYSTTTGTGGTKDLTGLSGSGRYVRMYGTVRGTKWGYSLWEMAVFGSTSTTTQYVSSGNITLNFDAGSIVDWTNLVPQATLPTGTNISYQFRTSSDGSTWSAWTSDLSSLPNSRYIQIQSSLSTTNQSATPSLDMLTLTYSTTDVLPTVSLSANPTSITAGSSSTLSWSSTNATGCTASGAWSGSKAITGSESTTPSATSTYSLTCTGSGGSATASTTITVNPATTTFDPMTAWLYMPWNVNAKTATVDPNSASMISTWVARGNIKYPNVTTNAFSQAWAVGTANDPHYNITITKYGGCDPNVPIPKGTQPSSDSDHHLAIFDTEHNREHDMWLAAYNSSNDTWSAGSCTSYNLGQNPPAGGGSNAAGFPAFSLPIWPEQIRAGNIPHALAFSVLAAKNKTSTNPFRYPATHSDGSGDTLDLPEGVWLRMPSTVNPNASWPAWTKIVFTALQNYGMYLMDQGGTLGIAGVNPINGGLKWSDVGMGTGGSVGFPSDFPWSSMQILVPPPSS